MKRFISITLILIMLLSAVAGAESFQTFDEPMDDFFMDEDLFLKDEEFGDLMMPEMTDLSDEPIEFDMEEDPAESETDENLMPEEQIEDQNAETAEPSVNEEEQKNESTAEQVTEVVELPMNDETSEENHTADEPVSEVVAEEVTDEIAADIKEELPAVQAEEAVSEDENSAISETPEDLIAKTVVIEQTVTPETPTGFELVIPSTQLNLGLKEKYKLLVSFSDNGVHSCTFKSYNSKIAKVNSYGVITAVKKGKTTIHVSCEDKVLDIAVTVKKAPPQIKVTPTKQTLGVGEQMIVKASYPKGGAGSITYSSNRSSVATVAPDGTVMAVGKGTAKITAKCYNGKKAVMTLTVKSAPVTVALPANLSMGVGQKLTMKPVLNAGSYGSCMWYSDNQAVASIDANGVIKAYNLGSAVITCETYNHLFAQCVVTVKAAPTAIGLTTKSLTLYTGEKMNVPVVVEPDCEPGLSYKSSAKKCVTVSATGEMKGIKQGSATITVSTYNGKKAKLKVKVKKGKPPIRLGESRVELGIGEVRKLTVYYSKSTTFSSQNPAIVSVDGNGYMTAIAKGETVITASTKSGKKATCLVYVNDAPTAITLESEITLSVGQSYKPAYTMNGSGSCVYASSNESVIKVDAYSGMITAVGAGEAIYTIASYNGVTAQCTVRVIAAAQSLSYGLESIIVMVGETVGLPPLSIFPEGVSTDGFMTTVTNSGVAALNGDGTITGVSCGTCTVITRAPNGPQASIKVQVVDKATGLTVGSGSQTIQIGDVCTPSVKMNNGMDCSYRLESSDSNIVKVEEDGVTINAVSCGTAVITARSDSGLVGTMTVEVVTYGDLFIMNPAGMKMDIGDEYQLQVEVTNQSGAVVRYESSNIGVATVSEQGLVKAVGEGACVITAVSQIGCTAQCAVTVGSSNQKVILDISHYQTITDYDQLANNVSFVILRATCGVEKDNLFEKNAEELNKRGVPFGVYCYGKATSNETAQEEADYLYRIAAKYNPKFYVYDAESASLTGEYIKAFTEAIRAKSGVNKVGCYCAHHKYTTYGMSSLKSIFDFMWIPRYGKNDGTLDNSTVPAYPCDLWQYTSKGSFSWIKGNVDVNYITGTGKSLSWFMQ